MSRRDIILKATSGAVQPKSLDLTKYRQRSVTDRSRTMRAEEAAGAMAYSAMDWKENPDDEEVHAGNPLTAALIRLKYADQHDRELFARAHEYLLLRHAKMDRRRPSEVMVAISIAALFEWIHDACPRCRGRRQGAKNPPPCPVCKPPPKRTKDDVVGRRDTMQFRKMDGTTVTRKVAVTKPDPGCPRCFGLGRVFLDPQPPKGIRCNTCWGTGRRAWPTKERWRYVNGYLVDAQRARKEPRPNGIDFRIFANRWIRKYQRFIDLLRAADKKLHESIDIQVSRLENADIVPGRYEQLDEPTDEPGPSKDATRMSPPRGSHS